MKQPCKAIVYYDADCSFCSGWVNWLAALDLNKNLECHPLQDFYSALPGKIQPLQCVNDDTLIVTRDEKIYFKSEAVFGIIKALPLIMQPFRVFKIIPLQLRDGLYDIVARNRMKFGKSKSCKVPK